jgi:tetratricopeptide (TPR) repeat protein
MNVGWKTVRLFISSTFSDMQAERDHLVRFAFPRLREQLLPRRIHLVDVDLRWGVTSVEDVSEVCREVIDECRPRFLCMLGGRYGWVPPGSTRSITADEVHYGVLDQISKDRGFAHFYFRDDLTTAVMEEIALGEFREPPGSDNEYKLVKLKQAIIDAGLSPFTYPAQWDNENRRLIGLKKFGDRVCDDLLESMKSDPELRDNFLTEVALVPDEFARERAAMEAFVEERSARFVLGSREMVLRELLAHAKAVGGNGYVCLTGAAGSGKSALLAHLSQHSTLNDQSSTYLIRHFVGASPQSTDVQRTLRRICHELKTGIPEITEDIPEEPEKLAVAFPNLLRQACARRSVVILLDGVNQFDLASQSDRLFWLPEKLPANARVILAAVDGPALEEMRRRLHPPREIELKPLTADDSEGIIDQFCKRYRKKLEPNQRAALLAKTDAGMPLYLLAALEELRTLGAFAEISRRIGQLPPSTRDLFAWILERLENDEGFRDSSGLRVGRDLVSRFGALLGASRSGLSERELVDLLDQGDASGNVAALLYLLRPYLMHRNKLLAFYHSQFREAVERRYLRSSQNQAEARKALTRYFRLVRPERPGHRPAMFHLPWQFSDPEDRATYDELLLGHAPSFHPAPVQSGHVGVPDGLGPFEKLMLGYEDPPRNAPPVSRRVLEYPWQLAMAGRWQELYTFLSEPILFRALWQHNQYDVLSYWAQLSRLTSLRMNHAYSGVLEHPEDCGPETLSALAILFRRHGHAHEAHGLHGELKRRAEQGQDLRNVAGSLMNQGVVLDDQGDTENAIGAYLQAESVYRQLGDRSALAQCLSNRGISLSRQEKYDAAMVVFDQAEELARQAGDRASLHRTLGEQAVIFKQRGELERAMTLLKEKETICRELDDRFGLAVALGNIALVLKDQGSPELGLLVLEEVETTYRELGDEQGLRLTRQNRGHLLYKSNDIEGALALAKSIANQDHPEAVCSEEKEVVHEMRAEDVGHPTAAAWDLLLSDDLVHAEQVLDACDGELQKTKAGDLWRVNRCKSYLLLRQNDPKAALDLCNLTLDMMRSSGCGADRMWTTKDFRFHIKSRL